MNISQMKARFGEEYPTAVMDNGVRYPLHREHRFSRTYQSDKNKTTIQLSRFMDGSASITALELRKEWPRWTEEMRLDFCQNSAWLHGQADFPEMLRFIMQRRNPERWSDIALSVASELPRDEAFEILVQALRKTDIGRTSNIGQAIAHTKHIDADATLRQHLVTLWSHPALWKSDKFLNWIAFDATTCIAHLIELGAPPSDFNDPVRRISEHICKGNRESCHNFLSKHYSWLKEEANG